MLIISNLRLITALKSLTSKLILSLPVYSLNVLNTRCAYCFASNGSNHYQRGLEIRHANVPPNGKIVEKRCLNELSVHTPFGHSLYGRNKFTIEFSNSILWIIILMDSLRMKSGQTDPSSSSTA